MGGIVLSNKVLGISVSSFNTLLFNVEREQEFRLKKDRLRRNADDMI